MQSSDDESLNDTSSMDDISINNYFLPMRLMTEEEEHQVRVEFFTNERSIKERLQLYFIKNQRSSLRIRMFNFIIKILTCILYVSRVIMDDPRNPQACGCHTIKNHTWPINQENMPITKVHWDLILFVNRPDELWIIQVVVSIVSLTQSCLITYLGYKGNILYSLLTPAFILECLNSIPFVVTVFNSKKLKCLFIPVFLNCWLAKKQLEDMFGDLNRVLQRTSSVLSHRVMKVISTTFCLIFTTVCGVQHLQRGGYKYFTIFESLYFVVVTFSTVGYGDYKPDIWPSQVFMIVMIVIAITVIPAQLEKLAFAWIERNKLGASYSRHRAQTEKHVVVCTTALQCDTIMDFLNEFYAHPKLQDYYVCLLSPCEVDTTLKMILQVPIWAERVIFIQGSALKDIDLARCRMQDAEACFILAADNYQDRNAADQHTIMRSWAVKDFAPQCPQYVQLYRPENKLHVRFAEHVVCEDEFKYALLGNNTLVPGISTLVTLLLHTSRGQEGQSSQEEWQKVYGKCSGNEVYHIKLSESRFFKDYEGKSFSFASFHAHRKYGVSLVAISTGGSGNIQLNPGPRHLMKATDTCFYLSITKEENSALKPKENDAKIAGDENHHKPSSSIKEVPSALFQANELQIMRSASFHRIHHSEDNDEEYRELLSRSPSTRSVKVRPKPTKVDSTESGPNLVVPTSKAECHSPSHKSRSRTSIAPVPDYFIGFCVKAPSMDGSDDLTVISEELDCIKGYPPVTPYIGTTPCLCHLMKKQRNLCCLNLVKECEHCSFQSATDYQWVCESVILCADFASYGLFNFIVPLRSHWRSKYTLKPIILLLESEPERHFLEAISYFPLIYWMLGSIESVDNLLKAGITLADSVVVVNKESSNAQEEETLDDCNTIIAVQTIYRMFPHVRIITELSRTSNMRFTLFSPDDKYALNMSKVEKKERARGSHISYIFRLPFAAGSVFSASMLDTLLYQSFVKSYLIKFVRLLLGVDQAVGSGHLTCYCIKEEDMWIRTYGRLYQRFCSTTCEIPIGIYRTIKREKTEISTSISMDNLNDIFGENDKKSEKSDIAQMIKCRLANLGLKTDDYENLIETKQDDKHYALSFVIINPNFDQQLQQGDIIYLIRPSSLSDKASPLIDERKILAIQDSIKDDKCRSMLNIGSSPDKHLPNFNRKTSQSMYSKHQKLKTGPDRQKFFLDTPQNSFDKENKIIEESVRLKTEDVIIPNLSVEITVS